ncbi:MAG: TIGR02221 family CRISPR-associated protein [Limnospira sp. PMC 1291.21]|uniref:CRISPR-associated protein, TM1812 family n=2 Tax=Limnospira TaxID=2596745 RepID=A0A9P1NZI8_9CYAN|nr:MULTISPECIES: TIGR02221 family CRISPR-associated protein [Limnospira]EKD07457.1 CRISPR-associated protein TM1812 family [Arthrospira platensis C1]MDC0839231.1 TIGR02221 family CRISPR-associated protein [Limnoraphis robusta]MDY7052213.1 TIGR02221 family CRISPR-associated protein [Limnospira fusiformis LS22]QJB25783.1 TIGR02221 family CRISPR-associated protein [Limnospira fusiformis SAG 85.79]RAQ47234.1 TIGR02221 family CRISPR-associated protein [Arthrospira sp. O9.13F]
MRTAITKIISFLGFNSYQVTKYQHPTQSISLTTKYYQEALAEFYQPQKIYIFLTPTVETKCPGRGDQKEDRSNWHQLEEILAHKFPELEIVPVKNIPERNSPEDIWTIFNKVNECLEDGDRVIFDITHSFRSVPIVALLAVSYFRVVRNITIEGLLYGAFEAKENGITPTFDLLPVVRLFDWLTATDQFLKTGNGEDLAKLLQEAQGHTQALGDRILEISQGLQLLRPMDVMTAAAALPESIEQGKPDLARVVPPFELLLNRVVSEYGQFALAEPKNYQVNGKAALQKQLFEIEWYAKKGLYVQAISLGREWLPSLLCYHFELDPMEKQAREEMEILCCGGKVGERESIYRSQYKEIEPSKRKMINQLWNNPPCKLANLRNDVLHSGFRKDPKSVEEIKQTLQKIVEDLKTIAQVWGVFDEE